MPPPTDPTDGFVTKASPRSVDDTLRRVLDLVEQKGLTLFAVIDHSGEAHKVGLEMPATKLVVCGSPQAGTPVMLAAPLAALDLPLKLLIWEDSAGAVSVSYDSPADVAARHHLSADLRDRLAGIEALSDAAVAPQD